MLGLDQSTVDILKSGIRGLCIHLLESSYCEYCYVNCLVLELNEYCHVILRLVGTFLPPSQLQHYILTEDKRGRTDDTKVRVAVYLQSLCPSEQVLVSAMEADPTVQSDSQIYHQTKNPTNQAKTPSHQGNQKTSKNLF